MSELIDRKAALDALSNAVPSLTTPDGCGQFDRELQIVGEALVDAMQIVHALPTASSWHRVEDGLPPKGFALIGARKRPPEISEDVWDMWVCEHDGEWGWQDMDGYALRGITHWMPLPEPPQEEA